MKKIIIISVAFSFLALFFAASADFNLADWQYQKAVVPPAGLNQRAFVEIAFDNEIFFGVNGNLSDVRVIADNGAETAFVLAAEAPRTSYEQVPVKMFNLGRKDGELTTFLADIGRDGVFHSQLKIITDPRDKNFRREVLIEGSSDQQNWLTLNSNKYIYDYSLEFFARDTVIRYPEATFRYLRVTIFDRGEPPLRITGLEAAREQAFKAKEAGYSSLFHFVGGDDSKDKTTILIADLGSRGLPTNKLTLSTNSVNFNRWVQIEASNDNSSWRPVSSGVVFSYQTPRFTGGKLTIEYPETNGRYFRIKIFNKDDAPINISGVSFSGFVRKLVFEYDPALAYSVFYGNPKARFPQYDLADYLSYYDVAARRPASLAAAAANPSYQPPIVPLTERNPNLLNYVLIAAVAVVGFFIFRLFKRV